MRRVSVIIPVYNDAERLRLCLDCLAEQTLPRDAFEVIVVDNGSDSPPRDLVEGYPFAEFAEETKQGSYAARNRGLRIAQGEVVAFTDADCLPHATWLEEGVRAVDRLSGGGLVGGRIVVVPRDLQAPTGAELFDMLYGLDQHRNIDELRHAATANAFTRRSVFDAVGPFNDALKSGGDVEWGQRVAAAGLPVVLCDAAVVDHPARLTVEQLIVQSRRHAGGRIDKRRASATGAVRRRDALNAIRLLLPPTTKFREINRRLRAWGYPPRRVPAVCWIAWLVRLNKLWAGVAAAVGRKTERR